MIHIPFEYNIPPPKVRPHYPFALPPRGGLSPALQRSLEAVRAGERVFFADPDGGGVIVQKQGRRLLMEKVRP